MPCCCFRDSRSSNSTLEDGCQWAGPSGRNNCRPNLQCSADHCFPLSGNNPSAWHNYPNRNTERSRLCQETTIVSEERGRRSCLDRLWHRNTDQSSGGRESTPSVGQVVKGHGLMPANNSINRCCYLLESSGQRLRSSTERLQPTKCNELGIQILLDSVTPFSTNATLFYTPKGNDCLRDQPRVRPHHTNFQSFSNAPHSSHIP